ncbi:unnamed protein product [Polarella glacialis]|uniref:CAAX prenyl protease 1 N-terminal domain-containing protein n=1 Tax=Polarella glacialis TaxID=89957 RepID=A0A813HXW3_POLGL|nr:unnamed protein product [Polarella glacialis]
MGAMEHHQAQLQVLQGHAEGSEINWPLALAVLVAVPELISLSAALLQRSCIGSPLPAELQGIYDQDEYATSMRYTLAKSSFSLWKNAFELIVFFAFWLLHGFPWLDSLCMSMDLSEVQTGLLFMGILATASQVLDLPWAIYHTFVLEESFGFNKTTPATFAKDRLKGLSLRRDAGRPCSRRRAVVSNHVWNIGVAMGLCVHHELPACPGVPHACGHPSLVHGDDTSAHWQGLDNWRIRDGQHGITRLPFWPGLLLSC